ncbi:Probable enoyl-CoA hydratase/isomerase [Mycobacteroides abscessus]|nr:Probable enoyl-CoA hydratase/isomerase [Mycobacteroides abscessus]
MPIFVSEDAKEGAKAFAEKRAPSRHRERRVADTRDDVPGVSLGAHHAYAPSTAVK